MAEIELNILRIDTRRDDVGEALRALRERLSPRGDVVSREGRRRTIEVFGRPLAPAEVVERICTDVRRRGISAVLDYGLRLDKAELTAETIRVPAGELEKAHAAAGDELLRAIRRIRGNILDFQKAILHRDVEVNRPGVRLRQRYLPIERAGLCVPGGAAAYPSTVLMTAAPAQAAGVKQLVVVAPPTRFGAYNADLLATCHELGITEVYRVGGAQGVAALAYGVEGIAKVDKIVGPGNLFVALAKKFVYGEVAIDSIAGPSEVVVIADGSTQPRFTAADILAQAEHAPGASILVAWSEDVLDKTCDELRRQVATLDRGGLAAESLAAFGAMVLVRDPEEACEVANLIAPEHLHVATENAEDLLGRLRNAGAIFLGAFAPVAVGDYIAGPSHVLPTSGTARWTGGLSANDFLRAGSVISFTQEALEEVADDVQVMADTEGLTAHGRSVGIRVKRRREE